MRGSRVFLLMLLLAVAAAATVFHESIRLATVVAGGRSPDCPLPRAIRATEHKQKLTETKDRILAASKKIEQDEQGFELWDTPKGRFWIPKGNQFVLPFNLAEQELNIYGTGENFIRPGDIVLDCGAHVGVFVRKALDSGAKLIVAIEPAPENIACLRRTYANEIASGRVIVYPKGVWDREDMLEFHVDDHNTAADSFLIQREGGHSIGKMPVTTIDKIVPELKLERVDFIKMDIEGAEVKALDGARETIGRFHPRQALAVYHAADHPKTVPAAARAGWSGYTVNCGPCAEANGGIRPDIIHLH